MQHTIQTLNKISAGLALSLFLATPAMALKDDTNQPLNVVSKEQIADFDSNKAIFLENVIATQGTMEVHADKAELTRDENDELKEVIAYGKPATFKQ